MTSLLRNISRIRFRCSNSKHHWTLNSIACRPSFSVYIMNRTDLVAVFDSSQNRLCSTKPSPTKPTPNNATEPSLQQATLKQKLKKAVAEYGSTVIVFHISISLMSLGVCYLFVSSGLDVTHFMSSIGIDGERISKIATNAGTFAVAYAVHKIFAPVRIMITLAAAPLIVRYLRQIGILKKNIK